MPETFEYVGSELELFREARNWKEYLRRELSPHIVGDVLEVGAGIGSTCSALFDPKCRSWTCLEPDANLAGQLSNSVQGLRSSSGLTPQVVTGTLSDLRAEPSYDTLLYVDVLEHIEDDRAEIASAATRLKQGGKLVTASPAHNWLYSPFDKAIGHFRRYDRTSLLAQTAETLVPTATYYLDSVGTVASLGNRLVSRAATPKPHQIALWDRWMVPLSRVIDPLLRHRFGKTIVAVWSKV